MSECSVETDCSTDEESMQKHSTNARVNDKKRKFDESNSNSNTETKRRKVQIIFENLFTERKRFMKQINTLQKERDYYKKQNAQYRILHLQMTSVIQRYSLIEDNTNVNVSETSQTQSQSQTKRTKIANNDSLQQRMRESLKPKAIIRKLNGNKSSIDIGMSNARNDALSKITKFHCKKCNRYFKNGAGLGGHNATKHNIYKNNYNKQHYCKICDRYFVSGAAHALCGHKNENVFVIQKQKSLNDENKFHFVFKDWNDCHFVSVDCICGTHFDNFVKYSTHLERKFKCDPMRKLCIEENCDGKGRYKNEHTFIKPFHCSLKHEDSVQMCGKSYSTKTSLIEHLRMQHKIVC